MCVQGKQTIVKRKKILLKHKKEIEDEINSLKNTLAFIDKKTDLYDKFLSGEIEYYSYLIKKQ